LNAAQKLHLIGSEIQSYFNLSDVDVNPAHFIYEKNVAGGHEALRFKCPFILCQGNKMKETKSNLDGT
jgi:hypothetical protein